MTPPMTPREKVARVIAAELCRQDEDPEMTPEGVEFSPGDGLCWNYIDQGLFDFGQCADAILTALASGSGDHADHSGGATNMVDHDGLEVLAWAFKLASDDTWDVCLTDPRCDTSDFSAVEPLVTAASAEALLAENAALRAANDVLEVERIGLRSAIFGSHDYDPALRHGNFIEMVCTTEDARKGALNRATEAERKLAEAVGLMGAFAAEADRQDGVRDYRDGDVQIVDCRIPISAFRRARIFLSKEAERG